MNQRTIAQLRTELDARKAEHARLVEELSEQWESKLREAKEDYQRLVVSGLNIIWSGFWAGGKLHREGLGKGGGGGGACQLRIISSSSIECVKIRPSYYYNIMTCIMACREPLIL